MRAATPSGTVRNVGIPLDRRACAEAMPSDWWRAALSPAETDRTHRRPDWAFLVDAALHSAPAASRVPPPSEPGTGPGPSAPPEDAFVAPLSPFVDAAMTLLELRTAGRVSDEHIDLPAVRRCLRDWIGHELAQLAARTFVQELHRMREAGLLVGSGPQARFVDFLRQLGEPHRLAALLARYPVLARLLGELCVQASEAAAELLVRFTVDRRVVVRELLAARPGLDHDRVGERVDRGERADHAGLTGGAGRTGHRDPGPLVEVRPGAGDLHGRGRSVTLCRLADGSTVVYKPRSVGLLARFGEVLGWFAGHLPELALRRLRVVEGAGYGWVEYVQRVPCRDGRQVDLFYRRQGALLALLYALDATDMHCENLIAHADQPVLIDVETLLHPTWTLHTTGGADPALAALHKSVMRTALLPHNLLGEHGALDISGFGAGSTRTLPNDVLEWRGARTDQLRLARGVATSGTETNRPVLDRAEVDPIDYATALVRGFREGYDILVAHATEFSGPGGPLSLFAGDEVRLVPRHTRAYSLLMADATRPSTLVDGLSRWEAFAALREGTGQDHLIALVRHELEDLFAGNIPVFTARADSRDVRTSTGHVLPGLLPRSGLDLAREKIRGLGAADRREQEWFIEAALATKHPQVQHRAPTAPPARHPRPAHGGPPLLAVACSIGDDLVARSRQDADRVNWVSLERVDDRFWSVLPMGAGLGEGYCGTALFLAELGRVTGATRYLDVARKAVHGLPALLTSLAGRPDLARHVGSGGYAGFGGIAYAVARLASLLSDQSLADCLPTAVELTRISDAAAPGVGEGTAGAVVALLSAYAETGLAAAASAAVELAGRLPGQPPGDTDGFVRGPAGTHWARRRFALAAGTPIPDPAPVSHPGPGAASDPGSDPAWASDPASGPIEPADPDLGWCAGAAGHILAGLDTGALAVGDARLDTFVTGVSRRGVSADHSLCHGDLGTLEALVEIAVAGQDGSALVLQEATARLLEVLVRYGPRCGSPRGVPTPGLLTGTAGIGYGLLRLAFANLIPSVLLLRAGIERTLPQSHLTGQFRSPTVPEGGDHVGRSHH